MNIFVKNVGIILKSWFSLLPIAQPVPNAAPPRLIKKCLRRLGAAQKALHPVAILHRPPLVDAPDVPGAIAGAVVTKNG